MAAGSFLFCARGSHALAGGSCNWAAVTEPQRASAAFARDSGHYRTQQSSPAGQAYEHAVFWLPPQALFPPWFHALTSGSLASAARFRFRRRRVGLLLGHDDKTPLKTKRSDKQNPVPVWMLYVRQVFSILFVCRCFCQKYSTGTYKLLACRQSLLRCRATPPALRLNLTFDRDARSAFDDTAQACSSSRALEIADKLAFGDFMLTSALVTLKPLYFPVPFSFSS